jgi:hypothetical protein
MLSRVFRGKFVAGLRRLFTRDQLRFFGECVPLHNEKRFAVFLRTLYQQDWVVYAKPPFGGPEHVLHYLARYTHRVAISNHRLLSVSADEVCFHWKDYAHYGKQRALTLASEEFLRRLVQHVLPRGFPRIRYFGFPADRRRGRMLPLCRALLHQARPQETPLLAKPSLRWKDPMAGDWPLWSPALAPDHPTDEDLSAGTPVKRKNGARSIWGRPNFHPPWVGEDGGGLEGN